MDARGYGEGSGTAVVLERVRREDGGGGMCSCPHGWVLEMIPDGYAFLMIDRVLEVVPNVRASGLKNVSVNEAQLRLGRILVHLGHAEGPRFEHDPATPRAPLPKLSRVPELEPLREAESDRFLFVLTEVRRQTNKVVEGLHEARRILDGVVGVAAGG